MELGLWNTLWANCAFGTTFLALPTLPILSTTDPSFQTVEDEDNLRHDHETQTVDFSASSDSEESDGDPDGPDNSDKETNETETNQQDDKPDMQTNCSTSDSNFSLHSGQEDNNDIEFGPETNVRVIKVKGKRKKNSHQRIRYSREEYKCTMCPYTCTTEKAFLRHLRSHSLDTETNKDTSEDVGPRLSCPVCGKDRSGEAALTKHMQRHRDNRHFCCDICSFKTVQLKKLIQHRRMHTGERPHLCPHCVYRAARRDNLRSHVRRVHKKENLNCDTFCPRGMLLIPTSSKQKQQSETES